MKKLKFLLLASLVAFAACDEENPVDVQVGSVNVTVTAGGSPLQGVTVSLGAAGTTPQTTSAAGTAAFANVPVGTYTVTVTGISSDVVCSSTTQPVTVAAGQTTAVTFACNIVRTSSISGTVSFSNNDPRGNAAITITRTLPAPPDAAVNLTTNATGQYSLTGLRAGTYTVSLAVTTGCTTAAATQTVQIASGEARVVNFTCTVAPPPPPSVPATVAIESITQTAANGTQVPIPSNQVQGLVNVNLGINEGDQRVSRVRVLLGTQTVYDQTFAVAVTEMDLASFNVVAPVETREFNQTTGVPRFLNTTAGQTTPLVAQIFTVAGGATNPASAATAAVVLANQDATYVTVGAQRNALSTNTTLGGAAFAGLTWWNGDVSILALPVMYSGLAVQNVTMSVTAYRPTTATNGLSNYYAGVGGATYTVSRLDATVPYQTTLLATGDINDDDDPFDAGNGVGIVEDNEVFFTITVLRADGQPGPGAQGSTVCSDGRIPNFTLFLINGCASGQPAQPVRLDNYAPVAGQLDRLPRWSASYAWPSRAEPGAVVAAFSGVTGWINEGFTYAATRLAPDNDAATSTNATAPRVADVGVGLPTTGYAIFRIGSATDNMVVSTTPAAFTETFNNDVYFQNITVQDVFGAGGATTNQRTRFYDQSFDGTGTSSGNITTIQAAGSGARMGIDKGDPCFSSDGTTCNNQLLSGGGVDLDQDRDVIGVAGALTIGNGGVMDGTAFIGQILDLQGPEAGTPSFFPQNPVVTRLRQMGPQITSSTVGCWIGVVNNGCQFAGASGQNSGTKGTYDFYTAADGGNFYTRVNPLTGAVTNVNTDGNGTNLDMDLRTVPQNTGYFLLEMRPVDQAGNTSAVLTRTFVWDRTAPVVGGVSSAATVVAASATTFNAGVADELDLDKADFFLRWNGAGLAIQQTTTTLGEFGPAAFTTTGAAAATVPFVHSVRVAGGAEVLTSGSLFRVYDFGRNVMEAAGAVPAVTAPVPTEPNDITTTSLYSSAAILCFDTDANGCTNPTSTTLSFQVTGPTSVPFNRADFLVGIDVDNNGVVDLDGAGNQLFAPITSGSAVSVIANVSTFTRTVTVAQLVAASRRSSIQPAPSALDNLTIRAIGYRPNGTSFTVAGAVVACPAAAGNPNACTVQLQTQ